MNRYIALVFALLLGPIMSTNGQGIFIYKNVPSHSDSLAHVFRYDRVENQGFVHWVTTGGKRVRFEATQFHLWAELPEKLPDQLVTPAEKQWVSTHLSEISSISNRFQQALPITNACLAMLTEAQGKLKEGLVRVDGIWLTVAEYEIAQAQIKANETRKQQAVAAEAAKQEFLKLAEQEKADEARNRQTKLENAERENKRMSLIAKVESERLAKTNQLAERQSSNNNLARRLGYLIEQKHE